MERVQSTYPFKTRGRWEGWSGVGDGKAVDVIILTPLARYVALHWLASLPVTVLHYRASELCTVAIPSPKILDSPLYVHFGPKAEVSPRHICTGARPCDELTGIILGLTCLGTEVKCLVTAILRCY